MSKTINISDKAYETLKKMANGEFRSLTKQFDMVLAAYVKEIDSTPKLADTKDRGIKTISTDDDYDSDIFYSAEDEKVWNELEEQLTELINEMSPLELRLNELEYKEAIGTIGYNEKERNELCELRDKIAPIKKQYDSLSAKRNRIKTKD